MRPLIAISVTLLAVCMVSCDRQAGSAPNAPKTIVILVRNFEDPAPFPASDSTGAERTSIKVVPTGKSPLAERLGSLLADVVADTKVKAVVVCPAKAGSAAALQKIRALRSDLVCILGDAEDEALAAEASADLVVDLPGPASAEIDITLVRGLCELARRAVTGRAKVEDRDEVAAALRSAGGVGWKVSYRVDPASGIKAKNHLVVAPTQAGSGD